MTKCWGDEKSDLVTICRGDEKSDLVTKDKCRGDEKSDLVTISRVMENRGDKKSGDEKSW